MRKIYSAMLAAVTSVALSGAVATQASALPGAMPGAAPHSNVVQAYHPGPRMGPGPRLEHRDHREHREFRHRFGPRFYVAPVYSYRAYGDGCFWLKRKALNTGSRYWWHRYEECRWG